MPKINPKILVVDYGFGNLFSIAKAFQHLGVEAVVSDNPKNVNGADGLILPGVGAFGDGMASLKKRGFIKPIIDFVKSGKSLLGICLGMQFLFEQSEEFGKHNGLGLIKGVVRKISLPDKSTNKIPHIGWNDLLIPNPKNNWSNTVLATVKEREQVYFVHSFAGYPSQKKDILANTIYGGKTITAVVTKKNIIGTQFHPEKSGKVGLKILSQFINLVKKSS